MSHVNLFCVAVDAPLGLLTYSYSDGDNLQMGSRVRVPLGPRTTTGVVVARTDKIDGDFEIKEIIEVMQEYPVLSPAMLKWLTWLSEYYCYPVGNVFACAYPPAKKKNAGTRKQLKLAVTQWKNHQLTEEQQTVVRDILSCQGFAAHLVFGVTGSGKTEVYMQVLAEMLAQGKGGLVLVPEISLTPQLIQRFVSRFGDIIAVIHSHLSEREKTDQWWDVLEGRKRILIGARSALFCSVPNLGVIVVDEEHEPTYKQEEKLKYHARDSAVMLAKLLNCPVVLGSATPSAETWKNAIEKKYFLHQLPSRVEGRQLPIFEVVDLKKEKEFTKGKLSSKSESAFWLSSTLLSAISKNFQNGKQTALFLNRRGMAQMVICPLCGNVCECPNCDISLTLHNRTSLVCHYCDYHESLAVKCPSCHEGELKSIGLGTEKIEADLAKIFPSARLARADRDEITGRKDIEDLITRMENNEIDILVGTQMIAKGLDFKNLTLVGLVLADVGFNLPDFRATERAFQLVTQVAGRAGRHVKVGEDPGKVIIQTFNPLHPAIHYGIQNNYEGYMNHELSQRSELAYPPYSMLCAIRIQGSDQTKVHQTLNRLTSRAQGLCQQKNSYGDISVLGPAAAPLARIKRQYRYQVLLKGVSAGRVTHFAKHLLGDQDWVESGVKIVLDINPGQLL